MDPRFGRAEGFIVYDTDSETFEAVDNKQVLNSSHGAGIQATEAIVRKGANCVVTGNCGPMVHARLGVAAENSGKLVSSVRREARRLAEENGSGLVIVDGPPGIGCPVIASMTGTSQALVVTEPTVSGEHDLERVLKLARHFDIPAWVCVNKWDLNPAMADQIEALALRAGAKIAGRIRYDRAVTLAQMQEKAVVETDTPSADDIRCVWKSLGL